MFARVHVLRRAPGRAALLTKAEDNTAKLAVVDKDGAKHSYGDLLGSAYQVCNELRRHNVPSSASALVLAEPGAGYVAATYGSWAGGLATVPLCNAHTVPEMLYYGKDSESAVLLHDAANAGRAAHLAADLGIPCLCVDAGDVKDAPAVAEPVHVADASSATLVYTSGTTGNPKGVVHTHASLVNQIEVLVSDWKWTDADYVLNCLPLHHVHGLVNVLLCALYSGATCEFTAATPDLLHAKLAAGDANVFMAVPPVYAKLLAYHATLSEEEQQIWKTATEQYRLMVSGSASLPTPVLEKWQRASGQVLLERYGMTEVGMILSQPLHGERIPGTVGHPLPTVEASIDPSGDEVPGFEEVGGLLIKSRSMFSRYYGKPEATAEAFTSDGWFVTGDYAGKAADGTYSILGRTSVDILKSSGYKISALDIEAVLLQSSDIAEAAVLGVPDETYGQIIAAVIAPREGVTLTEASVTNHCKQSLAKYKLPRLMKFVDAIPRNAMGKVNKKQLVKVFE